MRIGICGGSFNPIHNGHINLAMQLLRQLNLDKVIFIPANIPPHKQNYTMVDREIRYKLCCLACEGFDKFEVSDMEIKTNSTNYTVDTLKEISYIYKDSELFLLLGSDMFKKVGFWRGFDEIKKMAVLCTVPRNYYELEEILNLEKSLKECGTKTNICKSNIFPTSSTEIREKIKKGESVEKLLPVKVYNFIMNNGLYRCDF